MTESLDTGRYCQDMVRADDPDRYYSALFAPARFQAGLFALYAFNQEVAKTRESVSDPMLGEIRLQWWREALDGIEAGHVRSHPVVEALAQVEGLKDILPHLRDVIDARGQDMYDDGTADFASLESYADGVGGALQEAAAILLGLDGEEGLKAARAAGQAYAMLGLVRALPFHWQAGRSYMPQDADVAVNSFTDAGKLYPALKPTIECMVEHVTRSLAESRQSGRVAGKAVKPALAINGLTRLYLGRLKVASLNPFELGKREPSDLRRLMALSGAALLGKY